MKAKFVNEKFIEQSDPIKDMDIGEIHIIREKVRSHNWGMTEEFLNRILYIDDDFGYETYMGYNILTYKRGNVATNRWWSVTSRDHPDKVVSSSGGKASETKESSIRDIKIKIRRRKRILKTFED